MELFRILNSVLFCHFLELVLKYKPVEEDCTVYDEYCYTTYSNVSINVDTVVCKTATKVTCSETEENEIKENICHRNSVAICSKTPKLVTVTLKKQPCGSELKPTVTKMCVTHPDGKWACQDTMGQKFCFDRNVTKVISTEVTTSEMECEEKELDPICHDSNCHLESQGKKEFVQVYAIFKSNYFFAQNKCVSKIKFPQL